MPGNRVRGLERAMKVASADEPVTEPDDGLDLLAGWTELRAKADADPKAPNQGAAAAPAEESAACCGVASGLVRMLGGEERKEQAQPRATESVTTAQPAVVEKAKSA